MQKFLSLLIASIGLFWFSGCGGDGPDRRRSMAEQMGPPTPAMDGKETFVDGQLEVEATLGRGMRGHGGPGGRGGGRNREWRRHDEDSDSGEEQTMEDRMARERLRVHDSPMPPIVLQLHVTNKGAEPLDIVWVECNSILGNFAVQPEKMKVDAGQTLDTERMTSLLGVSGDEIPVTVSLRAHGKTEKKVITLHVSANQPPPAGS